MARIKLIYPEQTLFSHDLSIRITDLNYGNHLAHDRLISLMHEARAQFFVHFDMQEHDIDGVGIIMADIAVSYKAESHFGQTLTIDIAVNDLNKKGCDMLYRLSCRHSGQLIALAKTGLVFFDYEQKKPVSIPQKFLNILN